MVPSIQYIEKEFEDSDLAGWTGPGWYFWDETQSHCYGPYAEAAIAKTEQDRYALVVLGYEGA